MHELPVTESILSIVIKHAEKHKVKRVVTVSLRVGELSDLEDEWIQRYFDYLSKGTLAEGAKLEIERSPVVLQCGECGMSFHVNFREVEEVVCPRCSGRKNTLVAGREYFIKNIAVV